MSSTLCNGTNMHMTASISRRLNILCIMSKKKFSETDVINTLEFLTAYLWVQTMLLLSSTCSVIRMRQTSYRGFSRKRKEASPIF